MIKLFNGKRRVLFFPVKWANSVTLWLQNVLSPDNSIKVSNTTLPSEGNSLKLSVNFSVVCARVLEYFKGVFLTRKNFDELIQECCDHNTIEFSDGRFRISKDGTTPEHIDTHDPPIIVPLPNVKHDASDNSEALDTEWDRNTAAAGVTVNVFSRQIVDSMGTVYWLYRPWTIDMQGRIVKIGAEVFGHDTMEGLQ